MPDSEMYWADDTSVLFTSFWGWTPGLWASVGFTGDNGLGRRNTLLREMTDPFITVGCVTKTSPQSNPALRGKIVGFYVVSHESGDRDEFTHPNYYNLEPTKWRHALRAVRAFSYVPETPLTVDDFDPSLLLNAQTVAAMGKVLKDVNQIGRLRALPHLEVDIYRGLTPPTERGETWRRGYVRAGPNSEGGYAVPPAAAGLPRQLYVLRLDGDTSMYLGRQSAGREIYKIGLSVSPDLRRESFQTALPNGAYKWVLQWTTLGKGLPSFDTFEAAEAGEYAMKRYLADHAEWLGGEFYLADYGDIDAAWRAGHAATRVL